GGWRDALPVAIGLLGCPGDDVLESMSVPAGHYIEVVSKDDLGPAIQTTIEHIYRGAYVELQIALPTGTQQVDAGEEQVSVTITVDDQRYETSQTLAWPLGLL